MKNEKINIHEILEDMCNLIYDISLKTIDNPYKELDKLDEIILKIKAMDGDDD